MFKKLSTLLKEKYKGQKLMEVDADTRNDKELSDAVDEMVQDLMKFTGSTAAYIHLENKESSLNCSVELEVGGLLRIYEVTLKKLSRNLEPATLKSIIAAQEAGEDDSRNLSPENFKELLDNLPPDMHDAILKKMAEMAGSKRSVDRLLKGTKSSTTNTDEKKLLDDLLE